MVHPELAGGFIIGQTGCAASGVLGMVGIRAPGFVPEGLSGLLFETHGWYWFLGILAGVALIFAGRNRQNRGMMRAGAAVAGATALWVMMAMLVITPGERLRAAHEGLLEAARTGDVDQMVEYLAPDFECTALSIPTLPMAKEKISALMKQYGIKGSKIVGYTHDISGLTAYTRVTLVTEVEGAGGAGAVETTWGLSWDDMEGGGGGDWKIKLAELQGMKVGGENMQPVIPP